MLATIAQVRQAPNPDFSQGGRRVTEEFEFMEGFVSKPDTGCFQDQPIPALACSRALALVLHSSGSYGCIASRGGRGAPTRSGGDLTRGEAMTRRGRRSDIPPGRRSHPRLCRGPCSAPRAGPSLQNGVQAHEPCASIRDPREKCGSSLHGAPVFPISGGRPAAGCRSTRTDAALSGPRPTGRRQCYRWHHR